VNEFETTAARDFGGFSREGVEFSVAWRSNRGRLRAYAGNL
jgi:hypothetical protein